MDARRLGAILVAEGLISEEQLDQAVRSSVNGDNLLAALVKHEIIEETTLANFLAHQFGLETAEIGQTMQPAQARQIIPPETAYLYRIVPIKADQQSILIAMENPGEADHDTIRSAIRIPPKTRMKLVVAPLSQIATTLKTLYPEGETGGSVRLASSADGFGEITTVDTARIKADSQPDVSETLDPNELIAQMGETVEVDSGTGEAEEYSVDAANEAPVKRMCNYLIADALKRRASDIHINPTARGLVIRFRIDGTLQVMPSPPPSMKRSVIARYKVMSNMNITERRKPQDGRIKIKVHEKTIDLRVSAIPQMDGENIVMRILDQSSLQFDLTKLGFEKQESDLYYEAIRSPYGMILHTGPTGSGKTTTLYSALSAIFDPKKSFVTLEDPVEYEMANVVQVQMDHDVGLDFATALRSAMRQDPNILMVGEIRDKETAKTAISAALTGHLLFSTLHTNDAPSTIARLIDIGIEPAYVGTAVRLIVAQRLMKRVCSDCKQPYTPTEADLKRIEVTPESIQGGTFVKSIGCPRCNMTGYKGRIGIYEMMRNTLELQEQIFESADTQTIRKVAESQGMRSLRSLALEKWTSGMTTIEEVQRVTMGGD